MAERTIYFDSETIDRAPPGRPWLSLREMIRQESRHVKWSRIRREQARDVRRKQYELPKLVEFVEYMLQDLNLSLPTEDLLDNLYSKRYRAEVWHVVDRMVRSDYLKWSSDVASLNDGDISISMMRNEMRLLASWVKRLLEIERENGGEAWYVSISYPMSPTCISKLNAWRDRIGWPGPDIISELESRREEVHSFGMRQSKRPFVKNSLKNSLDVVSLLSLGSGTTLVSRVGEWSELTSDTFRNRHVFVFCMSVPVLYDQDFQHLLNLCKELSVERADDCRMVIVARMNILADTEQVFTRLFSLFPASCLAVPYKDWDRRELIWKQLNCSVSMYQCFVYDTNGSLLTDFCVTEGGIPSGAEAFPFTENVMEDVLENRYQLRREGSLENLLRPYGSRSPVKVYEFKPLPEMIRIRHNRMQHISRVIKNKHVGLYVCCSGKLIPRLWKMYERCQRNNQEFEIVVLYVPLPSTLDSCIFKKKRERELQKNNVRGWWCLPFNYSVSLRFWDLTMDYECSLGFDSTNWREDKLIIVGTDGKILDMYGAKMLDKFGHIHPFTRDAVVKRKVEEMKKEQPLQLLSGSTLFRGNEPSEIIDADKLISRKEKIIVFMGMAGEYKVSGLNYGFHKLVTSYKKMKKKGVKFEVVFIEFSPQEKPAPFTDMPWYVCRHDRTSRPPLAQFLKKLFYVPSLVGFGGDGCIRSVRMLQQLYKFQTKKHGGLCLDDTLEEDMRSIFLFTEYREI